MIDESTTMPRPTISESSRIESREQNKRAYLAQIRLSERERRKREGEPLVQLAEDTT